MTATDELRRLLTKAGVVWWNETDPEPQTVTMARLGDQLIEYYENVNGTMGYHVWNMRELTPAQAIAATLGPTVTGETSDGYHTFNELYHHRAVLFSVIVRDHPDLAWKSKLHSDGTMYDGMFIVGIQTSQGQATYHYDIEPYWKMFDCRELERAPEWDGHTPEQAIERIAALGAGTCRTVYLVEISDDLLESWYTIAVYQCREAAESRAEALRREVDGVRHFARVSKLEVVDA